MEKPKVEVRDIPDLVRVDLAIRKLHGRIARLEQMMQMAMQQRGPGWVAQISHVVMEWEKVVDTLERTVKRFNSLKERMRG